MSDTTMTPAAGALGRRLAGLGQPPAKFLEVLTRAPQGRAQRQLDAYLADARAIGASTCEARLVLAAVERTVQVTAAGPVDMHRLAGEVLAEQLPALTPNGEGSA